MLQEDKRLMNEFCFQVVLLVMSAEVWDSNSEDFIIAIIAELNRPHHLRVLWLLQRASSMITSHASRRLQYSGGSAALPTARAIASIVAITSLPSAEQQPLQLVVDHRLKRHLKRTHRHPASTAPSESSCTCAPNSPPVGASTLRFATPDYGINDAGQNRVRRFVNDDTSFSVLPPAQSASSSLSMAPSAGLGPVFASRTAIKARASKLSEQAVLGIAHEADDQPPRCTVLARHSALDQATICLERHIHNCALSFFGTYFRRRGTVQPHAHSFDSSRTPHWLEQAIPSTRRHCPGVGRWCMGKHVAGSAVGKA
ncbi:uncharacterized protein PHACADRAFT_194762 [Phanerochaete carnosa HHB-10118-sp]|uniref:Uncharacterized protein n=1 Tax=Phanerochaete carnosa (strain HHB-10118-sp) TaxID=650164 RepID=K5W034_PHACS|nr:uncharacterized protein PHACADRAFT_194762 [Phanerochaete carnosa HHB-10118-sp]EKM57198.1 hypothetical protein PHACADRAFT_194762 [Phanerochaete carnosa HHB-10118-sp]